MIWRASLAGLLLALGTPVPAAGPNDCLSDAQRSEFFSRQVEASAISAMEVGPRLRGLREARDDVDKAREAWASCEADRAPGASAEACAAEHAAFRVASDALPMAESSHAAVLEELKAKTAARVKTIRDEYPACESAKR